MSRGILIAFVIGSAIVNAPSAIVRSVGLGYTKKYLMGGKTIVRPAHFNTRAHKKAFEDVGDYVTSFLTRDVLISYQDRSLEKESFMRASGVPLAIWHEVLEFFEAEGVIVRRWELGIPQSAGGYPYTPSCDAIGKRFEQPKAGLCGVIPNSVSYDPGLLTDEQKSVLIGQQHVLHPDDCVKITAEENTRLVDLIKELVREHIAKVRSGIAAEEAMTEQFGTDTIVAQKDIEESQRLMAITKEGSASDDLLKHLFGCQNLAFGQWDLIKNKSFNNLEGCSLLRHFSENVRLTWEEEKFVEKLIASKTGSPEALAEMQRLNHKKHYGWIEKQEHVTLDESNFTRTYYRPREVVPKENLERDTLKLVTVVALSQSAK